VDVGDVEISTVPFIRFRKSLTTVFPEGRFISLKWANKARERTVFVVNAAALPEFLKGWNLTALYPDGFAIQRLARR
jgi:hypothetical protein